MTRKDFLRTAGAPLAAPMLAQPRRRNLVFILIDDLRYDVLGAMGHPWVKTPNIDRLAKNGALFRNSFVTTSLCSPSRASILTGLYTHKHGVTDNVSPLPKDLVTFPQVLQGSGYRTALIGKWHMGGDSSAPRPGFDRWVSFRGQGEYNDPTLNIDGQEKKVTGGYVTDLITDESVRFIRENASRPFMMYTSHKAVHADFFPAKRHANLYSDVAIPHPKSMADTLENYRGKPDWVKRQRNSWHGVDGMYNKRIQFDPFYRDYCRCLAGVDDSVGTIVNELESKKLLDDTLVIFMGDNGFQFGEHGLIDKRVMYEASIRVPMIAHCPSLFQGGSRPDGMALNIDIAPTMLDAAGVQGPPMHGRSLIPLLQGKRDNWRTEFLYEYYWERDYPQTPTVIGLRTDQYSFMQYHGVWDLDELYDIQKDPDQMNNLMADVRTTTEGGRLFQRIKDPELKKLVAALQNRMWKIEAETGGRREPTWKS